MTKPRLAVSFSGGKTSAVMTDELWTGWRDEYEVSICFANTGCEHPATLDFVRDCQEHFNWPVVWLEAVVDQRKGKGIRHKVVNYETASRDGEPFRDYVAKYGLPSPSHPQCTSRLKEEVMDSYRHRELGWKRGTYKTAIGIRSDEIDRMSSKAEEKGLIYPLVGRKHTKQSINTEVNSWVFNLNIPNDSYGNCVWCWKKSLRKLLTVAQKNPELFEFPFKLDKEFATLRPSSIKNVVGYNRMFRNNMSTNTLLTMALEGDFTPYDDDRQLTIFDQIGWDDILDTGSACGESCEIGADE